MFSGIDRLLGREPVSTKVASIDRPIQPNHWPLPPSTWSSSPIDRTPNGTNRIDPFRPAQIANSVINARTKSPLKNQR